MSTSAERLYADCDELLGSSELTPKQKLPVIQTAERLMSRIEAERQSDEVGPALMEFIDKCLDRMK